VRRGIGVAAGAALVLVLQVGVARSAEATPSSALNEIGAQLMLRLFGETSDSSASFAAAHGDRTSESPFRELALQVRTEPAKVEDASAVAAAFGEARLPLDGLLTNQAPEFNLGEQFTATASVVHFTLSSPSSGDAVALLPSAGPFTVAYQPVPPLPAISPAPGTLAFTPPEAHGLDFVPPAEQIGAVRFEGRSSDQQSSGLPQLTLHDATLNAGANFDVRAGKRDLDVTLSSGYQQGGPSFNSFSAAPPSSTGSWQLPGSSAPLFAPSAMDLDRLSLGAGVSVPVVHGLTLNLDYDAQRLYGGYGLPGLVNLDTMSNTYGGKLTFNIPHISSSLSIGAYQDRFADGILPINGQTQTREDVNFTVKF
jgi:hypothetical protein